MILMKSTKFYQKLKNLKINNTLIEKYKDMLENPEFEQNYYSSTSTGIYIKFVMILLDYRNGLPIMIDFSMRI